MQVRTRYLSLLEVKTTTASALKARLLLLLEELNLPTEKVMSLGTDGASVMTGRYLLKPYFALLVSINSGLWQSELVLSPFSMSSGHCCNVGKRSIWGAALVLKAFFVLFELWK